MKKETQEKARNSSFRIKESEKEKRKGKGWNKGGKEIEIDKGGTRSNKERGSNDRSESRKGRKNRNVVG